MSVVTEQVVTAEQASTILDDRPLECVQGANYLGLPRDPQPWIIKQVIPLGGLVNVMGKPKLGKSFLGLGLAIAVSDPGTSEWMGFPVLRHGPVLYVQIDTPRSFWADRIDKLVKIGGYNIDNIWWTDALMAPYPFDVMQRKVVDQLREKIATIKPVMVVFDTLREIHQLDENDNTAMKQVLTNVVYTTRGTDATVVFVSHTRKEAVPFKGGGKPKPDSGDGDLMNDGRGASYVSGRMDVLMKLTEKRLIMKGRGLTETKLNVEQDDKTGMVVLNRDREEGDRQIKAVLAMPGLNKTQQAETLAEMAGLELAGARARIRRYEQREIERELLIGKTEQTENEGIDDDD